MRKITARITMSLYVTDEQYEKIIGNTKGEDIEVNGDLLTLFKINGFIDEDFGDSYIPGPWVDYYEWKENLI